MARTVSKKHREMIAKTLKERNKLVRKQKSDFLFEFISRHKIEKMLRSNYSIAMLFDKLHRDHKEYFSNSLSLTSVRAIRNILKRLGIYEKSCIVTQSMPQSFKLQYKFPRHYTKKDIEQEIAKTSRIGQAKVAELRRQEHANGGNYIRQYTTSYWKEKLNISEEEAKEKVASWKRSVSPRYVEFWLKKGLDVAEAKDKISEHAVMDTLGALRKSSKPKTEKYVKALLREYNVEYITQFTIRINKSESVYNKRSYIYDFYLPKHNIVIEVNGTFWHADPRMYKPEDILNFPGTGREFTAQQIWDQDEHKKSIAINRGYNIVYIWEHDIKANSAKRELLNELKL